MLAVTSDRVHSSGLPYPAACLAQFGTPLEGFEPGSQTEESNDCQDRCVKSVEASSLAISPAVLKSVEASSLAISPAVFLFGPQRALLILKLLTLQCA